MIYSDLQDALVDEHLAEIDYDQESTEQSLYIASPIQDQSSQTNARDLILVLSCFFFFSFSVELDCNIF